LDTKNEQNGWVEIKLKNESALSDDEASTRSSSDDESMNLDEIQSLDN